MKTIFIRKPRPLPSTEKECLNSNGYGLNEYRAGCIQDCDNCGFFDVPLGDRYIIIPKKRK